MLKQLVSLEYIFGKRQLAFAAVMVIALSVIYPLLIPDVSISFAVGTIYIGLLPVSLIAKASKFQTDGTICALPVTRREIVLGKFLYIAAVGAIMFVAFTIVLVVVPYPSYSAANVLKLDQLVNSISAIVLVASFIMPLVMRYGFTGVIYLLLGVNVLTVGLFIITATGGIGLIDVVLTEIPQGFRALRSNLGFPGYHIVAMIIDALAVTASYAVSVRLYSRKEL